MTIRKESKQYIRQQRKIDADLVKRPNEILKRTTDDGNLKLTFKSPTYYEKDIVVTKNAMLTTTPLIKTYASLETLESFILDLEGQEIITYNLTQNTTITDVINYNNGMSYKLYLKQDEVGGKSFVFDETISNITLFDNFQIDQTPNSITQIKIDVVEDTLYVQSYVDYKKNLYISPFKIPTELEWETERVSWGTDNAAGAFASPLKLTMAGSREYSDGSINYLNVYGDYWSSTTYGGAAWFLDFGVDEVFVGSTSRGLGFSIRLIKDEVYTGNPIDFVSETVIIDGLTYNTVLNPTTNRVWLDRNLGATQVATSPTDSLAYGDLYQWGRLRDGHEKRNSGTTTVLSTTDVPGHGDFILAQNWRSPSNNKLWQGVGGVNLPV